MCSILQRHDMWHCHEEFWGGGRCFGARLASQRQRTGLGENGGEAKEGRRVAGSVQS